ncbi:MAG: glycosyl hydrolase, partial [Thermoguttaceae bacterium]
MLQLWNRARMVLLALAVAAVAAGAAGRTRADLPDEFRAPPQSARAWVYWFWMNGNITREGITADLEAMHEAGIGG